MGLNQQAWLLRWMCGLEVSGCVSLPPLWWHLICRKFRLSSRQQATAELRYTALPITVRRHASSYKSPLIGREVLAMGGINWRGNMVSDGCLVDDVLQIEQQWVGWLLGKSGGVVREIEGETGARISLNQATASLGHIWTSLPWKWLWPAQHSTSCSLRTRHRARSPRDECAIPRAITDKDRHTKTTHVNTHTHSSSGGYNERGTKE